MEAARRRRGPREAHQRPERPRRGAERPHRGPPEARGEAAMEAAGPRWSRAPWARRRRRREERSRWQAACAFEGGPEKSLPENSEQRPARKPGRGRRRGAALWASAGGMLLLEALLRLPMAASHETDSLLHAVDLLPYLQDSPPTMQVQVEFCNIFRIVEKPYWVLFLACWSSAVFYQLVDVTRSYEERTEELGLIQKCVMFVQLGFLMHETALIIRDVGWLEGPFWQMYNMYCYMFMHSSVLVRAVCLSMVVWDWFTAKLLKRPVFGSYWDGKGWSDWERTLMLVAIFFFGASLFTMVFMFITHLAPAMVIYHPVFCAAGSFVIKIRKWLVDFDMDPDTRLGRGLVQALNSFVTIAALQNMITSMCRIYAGELGEGYLTPIKDDWASRHMSTWFECHLRRGFNVHEDTDLANLCFR